MAPNCQSCRFDGWPLGPNIINALVSTDVWRECPFLLGRARKRTFRFPPNAATRQ